MLAESHKPKFVPSIKMEIKVDKCYCYSNKDKKKVIKWEEYPLTMQVTISFKTF